MNTRSKFMAKLYYFLLADVEATGRPSKAQLTPDMSQQATSTPDASLDAISRYRKYLKSYYKKHLKKLDDKISIAPCSEFVDLKLVEKDDKTKSFLEIDALLTPESFIVLVEGAPGIGKSTLCRELCRKWDTLNSLQCYDIVLLLKLRDRYIQNATSLSQIFSHSDRKLSESVVDEVNKCEGKGVLLIFDGFEEMPLNQDENSLVMKLINGEYLAEAARLVTSRPSALHCKDCLPEKHRHIKILGFLDDASKMKYAENAFELEEPSILARFKNFCISNPVINSLMSIPINCAIIAQVYKDTCTISGNIKLIPKTMTQLYSTLVLVLIRRHMIGTGKWHKHCRVPNNLKDLPREVITILNSVSSLAYKGLFQSSTQVEFGDSEVEEGFQHLGLLKEVKELYICEGTRTLYSFLHLSVQEFLAAWHVSNCPDLVDYAISKLTVTSKTGEGDVYLEYTESNTNFETFGQFLAGLIGCEKFPIVTKSVSNEEDNINTSNYNLKYLYEAQVHRGFEETFALDGPYCTSLETPLDMYIFGFILIHNAVKWSVETFVPFDMLISSLADHKPPGGKISGTISNLSLNFDIESQYFNIKGLPQCIRNSILDLTLSAITDMRSTVSVLTEDIVSLKKLTRFSLFLSDVDVQDFVLYKALKQLPYLESLKLSWDHITLKGIEELRDTLATSCTLKSIELKCWDEESLEDLWFMYPPRRPEHLINLSTLVDAALSCSTIKRLCVNLPITASSCNKQPANLECVEFDIGWQVFADLPTTVFLQCLDSIAKLCELPTVKSFKTTIDYHLWDFMLSIPPQLLCPFLTSLNTSLHINPSISHLSFAPCLLMPVYVRIVYLSTFSYRLACLANAVKKDHAVSHRSLRKSKSLNDLSLNHTERPLPRCNSSLDLVELESLHNMHPMLYKALSCDKALRIWCKHNIAHIDLQKVKLEATFYDYRPGQKWTRLKITKCIADEVFIAICMQTLVNLKIL